MTERKMFLYPGEKINLWLAALELHRPSEVRKCSDGNTYNITIHFCGIGRVVRGNFVSNIESCFVMCRKIERKWYAIDDRDYIYNINVLRASFNNGVPYADFL